MKPLDPRLLPHLRPARSSLLAVGAASACGGVLVVAQGVVVGSLVANLVLSPGSSAWTRWLPWLLAVFGLRALASYVADTAAARASGEVSTALRDRLLASALARPDLVRTSMVGECSALATRGMAAIEPYLTRYVPALAMATVLPALTVAAIAWLDLLSGVIVLATLPLVPVFAVLVGLSTRDRADRQWHQLKTLAGHFLDVVTGLPTLVVHRRARAQSDSIRSITGRYRRATLETLRLAFASSAVLELIATISVALVAVSVGLRLAGGSLDLRTALIVLLLAPEAYWPLRRVGAEFHAAAEGTATFEQATVLLDRTGEAEPRPALEVSEPPTLGLERVVVRHPGASRPVLTGLDATVPARRLTAVAGPSGCGKSTLVAALLGELPVESGTIRVGDTRLDSRDPDSWRAAVAQTPQRPWLFGASIRTNLLVAHPAAQDADLWQALERVHLGEVVAALPDGLDSLLGEDGVGLSAGQQARLSLARVVLAVAKGRKVVLLDEPTAHLDQDTEAVLVQTLRWLADRATVVVVAHSPAVIAAADQVLELGSPPAYHPTDLPERPVERQSAPPRPRPAPSEAASEPDPGPRWGLRTGMLLGVVASTSGVALTATAGWLIAKAAEQPPVLTLMVAIVGVRLFGLARPVLRYAERLVSHDAALRLLSDRRAALYDALVPLVPGRLGVRRGELLAAIVEDVDAELDQQLRVRLPVATAVGVSLIGAATAVVIQSLWSAVALLGFAALSGGAAWWLARTGARRHEHAFLSARGQLWASVTELLHDARQLVLWGAGGGALARVREAGETTDAARRHSVRHAAVGRAWVLLASGLGVAAVAGIVSGSTVSPAMQALLVLVPLALGEVLAPLADAGALSVRTDRARRRLDDLVAVAPAVLDPRSPTAAPVGRSLEGTNLTAGWDGRPAFTGLDLCLREGGRVAVVGPSGCGKSTLAAVLLRFIDPTNGELRLDGIPVRDLLLDEVRGRIGFVDDDPHIFATSLVENVRLARPEADERAVHEALVRAHLGDWVAGLPHGQDTMLGDGHAAVSGGERTRIAIARSLLADHQVLVLDEPTAHLDTGTAQGIADEVLGAEGRAVVWITHGTVGLDQVERVLRVSPWPGRSAEPVELSSR